MSVSVAFGNLQNMPPESLVNNIAESELGEAHTAKNSRRGRELQWSRGLKAYLLKNAPTPSKSSDSFVSITHDKYLTAVVAHNQKVGIDLESTRSMESCLRIAEFWFPPTELLEVSNSFDSVRFLQSWVLKESWAKCMRMSILETCGTVELRNNCINSQNSKLRAGTFLWTIVGVDKFGELVASVSKSSAVFSNEMDKVFVVGLCLPESDISEHEVQCFKFGCSEVPSRFNPIWNSLKIGDKCQAR